MTICPLCLFGKIIEKYRCTMFFKKKKAMSDDIKNNSSASETDSDNMSQNEMNDILSNVLNTDDSAQSGFLPSETNDGEVEKLQAELDEMKDKYLRMVAEFDNFRRRTAREKEELRVTAGKDVIQSLLVVMDDMSRAEAQLEKAADVDAIKEGLSLVFSKFRHIMQQKGLKVMDSANADFNADLHEAITEIPAPHEKLKGKILDTIEPGYYLNDKLIRYAKVVVGN